MRIATIVRLREAADAHFRNNSIVPAFALYWLAYEGLWSRSLVKILWLRGSSIKDAERFIADYYEHDPIKMLGAVSGQYIGYKTVPFYSFVSENYQLRNQFFHQGIENRRLMRIMCSAFRGLFGNPSLLLSDLRLRISGSTVLVGDPLEDLRGKRRRKHPPRPLEQLVDTSRFSRKVAVKRSLTDEDVLILLKKRFTAPVKLMRGRQDLTTHRDASGSQNVKPVTCPIPLTVEEQRKRDRALAEANKRR